MSQKRRQNVKKQHSWNCVKLILMYCVAEMSAEVSMRNQVAQAGPVP